MNFSKYFFLLGELIKKGIRLKYRRSYLGILWSLIEPVLSTIVLVVVFGTLFNNKNPSFPLYILSGRLIYSFFAEGSKATSGAIRHNASMIKKVYVPKVLYPLASCIYTFIIFLISCVVLIFVQIYCQVVPTVKIFMVIPSLLILFALTFGVGFFLTTLNVFFRDIEYLWNVILMIISYMSAIFYYPEKILNSRFAFILDLNPLYQIIHMMRCSILDQTFNVGGILYAICFSIVMILISCIFYNKNKDKFILHL